ncbi:KUP/HAK/KT family potassium transporter [Paracidovorax citrulli]|uniref:KUP/HAK/KT family potassium transporter n=1 Tax=Paracidovorax citrulli TaxID=80869 RepID=UPI003A80DCBB
MVRVPGARGHSPHRRASRSAWSWSILTFFVIRHGWKLPLPLPLPLPLCIAATGAFLCVDVAFFASNSLKIAEGGWFPLLMATALYLVMSTWHDGRGLPRQRQNAEVIGLLPFLQSILAAGTTRVDGTAVFLTAHAGVVPGAMLHNLKHNKVLHDHNLFVHVQAGDVPRIPLREQVAVQPLTDGAWSVRIRFGFMDEPDIPRALQQARELEGLLDPMRTSYFLARETVVPTLGAAMAVWRQKLFAQMHHSASSAADFLKLPNNAVVEMGSKTEITDRTQALGQGSARNVSAADLSRRGEQGVAGRRYLEAMVRAQRKIEVLELVDTRGMDPQVKPAIIMTIAVFPIRAASVIFVGFLPVIYLRSITSRQIRKDRPLIAGLAG